MRSDMLALPGAPTFDLSGVTQAMADPAFELDANEGAAVIAVFIRARAAGYPFDPFTVALVTVLRRQIAETDEGFEDDVDVADFENDEDLDLCVTESDEGDDSWDESEGATCPQGGGPFIDAATRVETLMPAGRKVRVA